MKTKSFEYSFFELIPTKKGEGDNVCKDGENGKKSFIINRMNCA